MINGPFYTFCEIYVIYIPSGIKSKQIYEEYLTLATEYLNIQLQNFVPWRATSFVGNLGKYICKY